MRTLRNLQLEAQRQNLPHWIFLINKYKPVIWREKNSSNLRTNAGENKIAIPEKGEIPRLSQRLIQKQFEAWVDAGNEMDINIIDDKMTNVYNWVQEMNTYGSRNPNRRYTREVLNDLPEDGSNYSTGSFNAFGTRDQLDEDDEADVDDSYDGGEDDDSESDSSYDGYDDGTGRANRPPNYGRGNVAANQTLRPSREFGGVDPLARISTVNGTILYGVLQTPWVDKGLGHDPNKPVVYNPGPRRGQPKKRPAKKTKVGNNADRTDPKGPLYNELVAAQTTYDFRPGATRLSAISNPTTQPTYGNQGHIQSDAANNPAHPPYTTIAATPNLTSTYRPHSSSEESSRIQSPQATRGKTNSRRVTRGTGRARARGAARVGGRATPRGPGSSRGRGRATVRGTSIIRGMMGCITSRERSASPQPNRRMPNLQEQSRTLLQLINNPTHNPLPWTGDFYHELEFDNDLTAGTSGKSIKFFLRSH